MAKGKYQRWLESDGLLLLEGWARDGLTDDQIAQNCGCGVRTLYEWKEKYPQISQALKKGKEVVDIQVENALLKRALGYEYDEVTCERLADTGQKKRHNGEQELTEGEWEMCKAFFDYKCCYCGSHGELTKDHLQSLKANGPLSIDNIVPACRECNSSKKDNQWADWYIHNEHYSKERYKKIIEYIQFSTAIKATRTTRDTGLIETKRVTKHVSPDTTAQIFWLKNRMPSKYRDKPIDGGGDAESQKSHEALIQAIRGARRHD